MIIKNPKFKPLYTTKRRYILLTGGRAGAKSFEASTFLCNLTYERNRRLLFSRYTMSSAEISIIPEFADKIERLEVTNHFKINATDIRNLRTGSEILFRGIKTSSGIQTANLKSLANISCWCNDESEELTDENTFDTIDLSIRSQDCDNLIILLLNPSNKNHWIYRRWIKNTNEIIFIDGYPVEISTHPEVLHIHTTYLDNLKYLSESWVRNILRMKEDAPKTYGHKAIGQWSESAEGTLFDKAAIKIYKEDLPYEGSVAYVDVSDEGTDYTCCIIGRNIGMRIYITDIVFTDNNTDISIPLVAEALKRNNVAYCRVESNNMGGMFGRNLQKLIPECSVMLLASTTNKHTRILMESVFIMETFYFKSPENRGAMYESALNQMADYTKDGEADHDDAPDAASGLSMFVRDIFSDRYY